MSQSFYFTPSYYCTSDCLMCGVEKYKRDQKWGYSFAEAKSQIDSMKMSSGDILEISGGEPTAYKYLADIASYAAEYHGAKVLVLSHGRHLKQRKLAEKLAKSAITRFLIPVFSNNPITHDYLTQTEGSLKETISGLQNLQELSVATTIKFVPMKPNFLEVVDTFKFCHENFPRMRFVVSGYQMMGEAFVNSNLVSPKHTDVGVEVDKMLAVASECKADVAVSFLPLCHIDPSFWHYYRYGFVQEKVFTPDKLDIVKANERNYAGKPKTCSECQFTNRCQWAWYSYCKEYGESELSPFVT